VAAEAEQREDQNYRWNVRSSCNLILGVNSPRQSPAYDDHVSAQQIQYLFMVTGKLPQPAGELVQQHPCCDRCGVDGQG